LKRSIYILILIVVALFVKCSTDKDAWINKTYHNTTAHYNGYWNAKEIIKETMDGFQNGYVENYDKIIPVYQYPNEAESKGFKSPMDTAIKKCELVIFKHQMPNKKVGQFKRVEWCEWIDDNWFVIAESEFYKREYDKSLKKLKFIEKQYPTEPIIYDARLWQAKIYMEMDNLPAAKSVLDELKDDIEEQEEAENSKEKKEKPKKKKSNAPKRKGKKRKPTKKNKKEDTGPPSIEKDFLIDYYPTLADYYLRKKEYGEAIVALEKAIEIVKDRQFKTRLVFILAQLHHQEGNAQASELYAEVVKRNPKYDMAFIAKINKALAFSGGDKKGIKAELRKMLKDEKNVDYLDQIYYALGDIELSENNTEKGIEYLESSVRASTSNSDQKSKSFLRLGKLYYAEKSYIKAQKYYDSTLSNLSKEHPEYATIEFQNISLTELVLNLNTADHQDSLLNLCALSQNDLEKKIFELIDEETARKQAIADAQAQAALTPSAGDLAAKGDFWAFNEKVRNNGFEKYKEVWGTRLNEDNWRREDKTASIFAENDGSSTKPIEKEDPKLTVDYYTKDLPCGKPDLEAKAQVDIIDGYYNAANIYKRKLNDLDASFRTFQKLEKYLPNTKSIESLYQSYLINKSKGNTTEVNKYKDWLLNDYPDSEYAKIISDPKYLENLDKATEQEESIYAAIYDKFMVKDYSTVISEIDKRLKVKDNPYTCKYYYMKALSVGYSKPDPNNLKEVESALQDVVDNCNDELIISQAKSTLDKLRNTQSIIDAKSGASTYIYASDIKHYFVLVFPNDAGSVNQAKAKISDLNLASFSTKSLETKSSFIDENNQIITVRSFANKKEAMDYYITFDVNDNQVKKLKSYDYFVITNKNFSSLFLEKDIPAYLEFFQKNYLND
jgi:outer membrane protein assembly factor BamD (BamD/ComL family)